jgi:hypothetical protein
MSDTNEILGWKNKWECAVEMAARAEVERDEAREKYATEATEHMLAINKLANERDEAREEAQRFRSLHYSHLGINASASWFPWEGHE